MANLITLAEVKAYQGVTNSNEDALINSLITKVSALVKTYVGRTLVDCYSEEKVQVFSGGTRCLTLQEVPVNEISSVEYSIDYGKTYTSLVNYTDYVLNKQTDTIDVLGVERFPWAPNGLRVTYTGGYASVPEDLKLGVLDLVVFYLKSDMAVKSSRSAGANNALIEYVTNSTLPSHIRRVLDLYRLDLL